MHEVGLESSVRGVSVRPDRAHPAEETQAVRPTASVADVAKRTGDDCPRLARVSAHVNVLATSQPTPAVTLNLTLTLTLHGRFLLTVTGAAAMILTHVATPEPSINGAIRPDGPGGPEDPAASHGSAQLLIDFAQLVAQRSRCHCADISRSRSLSTRGLHAQLTLSWKLLRISPCTIWPDCRKAS